jgi:hypothetical protein
MPAARDTLNASYRVPESFAEVEQRNQHKNAARPSYKYSQSLSICYQQKYEVKDDRHQHLPSGTILNHVISIYEYIPQK